MTFERGLRSLAAASPAAWALDQRGALWFWDRTRWHDVSTLAPGELSDVEARERGDGGVDVWAVATDPASSFVIERGTDVQWSPIETTRSFPGAITHLWSSARDDVWAFGRSAVHFDGDRWTDTAIDIGDAVGIGDLCSFRGGEAYATTSIVQGVLQVHVHDASGWSRSGRIDYGDWSGSQPGTVRCVPGHPAYVIAWPVIAERTADGWRASPPFESLYPMAAHYESASRIFVSSSRGLLRYDGAEWTMVGLDALSIPPGRVPSVEALDDDAGTLVLVVALRSPGSADPTDPQLLVRHDGDRVLESVTLSASERTVGVHVVGPDHIVIVDERGGVRERRAGAFRTVFAPRDASLAPLRNSRFVSASLGYATNGRLHRFDGASWSLVTIPGLEFVHDVRAFGPSDVWAAGPGGVAHFDGSTWRVDRLPDLVGDLRLGGESASELSVIGAAPQAYVRRDGGWSVISLARSAVTDDPAYGGLMTVGPPSDLWVFATHASRGSLVPWLYHHAAGVTRSYRAPTISDLREWEGALVARVFVPGADEEVWDREGGRWRPRPDLDVRVVFPAPVEPPSFLRPCPTSEAAGSHWAACGPVIMRRDP